jgi:hypothetical protein
VLPRLVSQSSQESSAQKGVEARAVVQSWALSRLSQLFTDALVVPAVTPQSGRGRWNGN